MFLGEQLRALRHEKPGRPDVRRSGSFSLMGDGMSAEALRLFADLGITYYPPNKQRSREPLATCCDKFVGRLIGQHGLPHVTMVLRAIADSEGNGNALISDVIGAVSDIVLAHPRWPAMGLAFIEALDHVNLLDVRKTAKAANVHPLRVGVATLIAIELAKILGPSRPPRPKPPKPVKVKLPPKPPRSLTRVPEVEANVALGLELLKLRSTIKGNCAFGRLVRRQFDIDAQHACDVMRVARAYGTKREIFTRLSWNALLTLASSSMPRAIAEELETRIIAGEAIGASQIRAARGPLPSGRPRRLADQPVRMAAEYARPSVRMLPAAGSGSV
jgi:hypothetical protein